MAPVTFGCATRLAETFILACALSNCAQGEWAEIPFREAKFMHKNARKPHGAGSELQAGYIWTHEKHEYIWSHFSILPACYQCLQLCWVLSIMTHSLLKLLLSFSSDGAALFIIISESHFCIKRSRACFKCYCNRRSVQYSFTCVGPIDCVNTRLKPCRYKYP